MKKKPVITHLFLVILLIISSKLVVTSQDIGEGVKDQLAATIELIPNPYITGLRGHWRHKATYAYLTERTQSNEKENLNIRKDGLFVQFNPFWNLNTNPLGNWGRNSFQWTRSTEVTIYSPIGTFELENVDAIGRYTAAVYGFNSTLPIAVSNNARYREIGFDSFEDYFMPGCFDHFSFRTAPNIEDLLTTKEAHTGRHAIRVPPLQEVQIWRGTPPCEIEVVLR